MGNRTCGEKKPYEVENMDAHCGYLPKLITSNLLSYPRFGCGETGALSASDPQ